MASAGGSWSGSHRLDIHADADGVPATAGDDATHGADIREITTDGHGDVVERSEAVVGGVEIDPAKSGHKAGGPGMGGIDSLKARFARWRMRAQVTADVTCWQAHGAEAGDGRAAWRGAI